MESKLSTIMLFIVVSAFSLCGHGINLDINNPSMHLTLKKHDFNDDAKLQKLIRDGPVSIRNAGATIAYGLMSYYTNNASTTPPVLYGLLPYPPYYWWESGAMWGAMVDYATYTNNPSYLQATVSGLLSQIGPNQNYIVPAHVYDEGNDDQAFWGFALLSAAEQQAPFGLFPSTPSGYPSWLQLAENLFENQIGRWDNSSCGGGMKWQIYPTNVYGYDYKNAIANGGAFALAARLATLSNNQAKKRYYLNWATEIWNWSTSMGLVNSNVSPWEIYDGLGDDRENCTGPVQTTRWSYNIAMYLSGCAAMYNATMKSDWLNRTYRLLEATQAFTAGELGINNPTVKYVLTETACEPSNTCNTDQFSFKGYSARFMGKILNQWLVQEPAHSQAKAFIQPILIASAQAAATSCSGGSDGKQCGSKWYNGVWDGTLGAGQEMAALEVIQSLLTLN